MSEIDSLIDSMVKSSKPAKAFPPAGDFHSANTAAFFGFENSKKVFLEEPKRYKTEFRGTGKVAGLALVYGSSWKLFLGLVPGCTESHAHELYNAFFKSLPVFSAFDKRNIRDAKKTGYVMTFIKRVLYISALKNDKWFIKAKGERQAKNLPIQGAGSEIIKFFLLHIFKYIEANKCSRWFGTYLFSDYYTRVVSLRKSELTPTLIEDLESCRDGNIRVVVLDDEDPNKVIQEFNRSLQMKISLIKKHNLSVVL